MSKSKGKLIVILIAFAVLTMLSLACASSGNTAAVAPEPTPDPVQVKYAAMQNAYELGETLFFFDAVQSVRYALFYGNERIIFIKAYNLRGVKLMSNECLNLDIKKECGDGNWCIEYSFQNVEPGDYVYYENGLWRVTQYTP